MESKAVFFRGSTVEQFSPSLTNGRSSDVSRWFFTRHGWHGMRDLVAKWCIGWLVQWWCYCWWDKKDLAQQLMMFKKSMNYSPINCTCGSFRCIFWMFCRADSWWASPRRSATCHGKYPASRGPTFPPAPRCVDEILLRGWPTSLWTN